SENGYPRPVAIDILRHTGISILWMTTGLSTEKVKHIRQNTKAGVCFVHEADSITLTGKVEIQTDAETRQNFWQDYMLHYF
ncbi:pyridoxamine 5'-phosphate oxidase family protein, partial [Staphylococcus aureus]|nr:pyridoxamine 5'-phosphate oxidase family protein [Staphylococcus aureus]